MSSLLHHPAVLPRARAHVSAEMILMLPTGWDREHVLTEEKTALALRTQVSSPQVHGFLSASCPAAETSGVTPAVRS